MENLMLYLSILISLVAFAFADGCFYGKEAALRQQADRKNGELIRQGARTFCGKNIQSSPDLRLSRRIDPDTASFAYLEGNILTTYLWLAYLMGTALGYRRKNRYRSRHHS